jgi:hypothetical protein
MSYGPEEIGRLLQERDELNRRHSQWHMHKGAVLYVSGACGLMSVGALVFGSSELGATGVALSAIIAVGCYLYYRSRESQERQEWERIKAIDEIVRRYRAAH